MEMKSRSQVRRIRSQMGCTHDLAERETAIADGMCPLCLLKRINEIEAKLALHDRSSHVMIHKKLLKQIEEQAMNNDPKQYQKQINELSIMVTALRGELESERRRYGDLDNYIQGCLV
jgi:hypothetical protein